MCIEFPGVVVERDELSATIDTRGRRRRASTLLFPEIEVGSWVLVSGGTIVRLLDAATAGELTNDVEIALGGVR